MSSPNEQRMDALTEAIVRLLKRVDQLESRLARLEGVQPVADSQPLEETVGPQRPSPTPPPLPQRSAPIEEPARVSGPQTPAIPSAPPAPSTRPDVPAEAPETQQLETWMGLTWINRIGVITLVFGVAFFFRYAVDNHWIGETGRVILGVIAGLATVVAGGVVRRRGHTIFGQGVCGLGISILYLSFYASFGFYHLLPQPAAFVLMVMVTAMSGALALRYNAAAIAALGMLGGYVTPILLSTGHDAPWPFFSYVLLIDVGALVIARQRRWPILELFASVGTVTLYLLWFGEWFGPEKRVVATTAALAFYALFLFIQWFGISLVLHVLAGIALTAIWPGAAPYLALSLILSLAGLIVTDQMRRRIAAEFAFGTFWVAYLIWRSVNGKPEEATTIFLGLSIAFVMYLAWTIFQTSVRHAETRSSDLAILALNGPVYFGSSYLLLNPSYHAWMGLLAVAVAGANLLTGARLWKEQARTQDDRPVLLALGLALAFITLAIPIQFTEFRITLSWALEAAALVWIGRRTGEDRIMFGALAVYALVFARLYVFDAWLPAGHVLLANSRFVTFALSAISFWLGAWFLKGLRAYAAPVYITGHIVMLSVVLFEFNDWAPTVVSTDDRASLMAMGVSILMALYALMLIVIGVLYRSVLDRVLGLGLFGIVVMKLYLFDIWEASRLFRTVAFVALGLLLLLTSYLYSRFRHTIESWWRDEETRQ